jgi:hypothetical protein
MLLIGMYFTIVGESLEVELVQTALGWFNTDYRVQRRLSTSVCAEMRD